MLRIACPWCGVRDEVEFRYRGDATLARPDARGGDRAQAAFHAYVYERDNPDRLAHRMVAACRRLPARAASSSATR